DQPRPLLELDHHHRVRHLGGEARVVDLVHDGVAEDGAAPGDRRPLRLAREAAAAEVARREAMGPAAAAALHDQLVAARGLPEGRHLARDLREGLRVRRRHDGSRARMSVECVERTPPLPRSEEHTSELQSRFDLVCRLLLEKKKKTKNKIIQNTYTCIVSY